MQGTSFPEEVSMTTPTKWERDKQFYENMGFPHFIATPEILELDEDERLYEGVRPCTCREEQMLLAALGAESVSADALDDTKSDAEEFADNLSELLQTLNRRKEVLLQKQREEPYSHEISFSDRTLLRRVAKLGGFPSFVSEESADWIETTQGTLEGIHSIEEKLEELSTKKERLRRELDQKGFFVLSRLNKQLDSLAEMPAGNFSALMDELQDKGLGERVAFNDVIALALKARNVKPKKQEPESTGFGSLFEGILEDDVDLDPSFQLASLVRVRLETLRLIAKQYFAIDKACFERLHVKKAQLERRLLPKPCTPETHTRR